MPVGIQTPSNQVKHTNIAHVRLKKGTHFHSHVLNISN